MKNAEIDQLLGAVDSIKPGEQMVFTYVPGTVTTFTMNGKGQAAGPSSSLCGSGQSLPGQA